MIIAETSFICYSPIPNDPQKYIKSNITAAGEVDREFVFI